MYHNVLVLQGILPKQQRLFDFSHTHCRVFLSSLLEECMVALPLIIDCNFEIEEGHLHELRRRITQILCEPPATLFFVRVRQHVPAPAAIGVVVGDVYRVTLCGVGGKPLRDERQFLLFKKEVDEPLLLQYVACS
jgi:hypothetical protein